MKSQLSAPPLGLIRVSVVMPVLNAVSSFEQAIGSVLAQNYPELEIIVIDGGSTDGTLDLINGYIDHIAYWESGQDSGIADAFNRGISQASGDLIAVLNADDCWRSDTVSSLLETVGLHPGADIYYGSLCFFDPDTGNRYVKHPDLSKMTERMNIFHPSVFVRKSAYYQVGLYQEKYKLAMDSEWVHRALKMKLNFQQVDAVLATMALSGASDRYFVQALNEYRRSLIESELLPPLRANYNFVKFLILKSMFRWGPLKRLKQKLLE